LIKTKPENFVKPSKKLVTQLIKDFDRYHDKRYYLARVKRNGRYIWGLKMFRRARQIAYFKRMRAKK